MRTHVENLLKWDSKEVSILPEFWIVKFRNAWAVWFTILFIRVRIYF